MGRGLLFPEGPVACADGSVLLVEIQRKTVTRVHEDGRVEIVAQLDGGPNGMAFGPDGALYVCNNGGFLFTEIGGLNRVKPGVPEGYAGGWIERLELATGRRDILYRRCGEHPLVGPNDIVFDRHGGFYFTDFGKLYPRFRPNGGVYYALADGSRIVELAYPIIMPNGIGLSPDGATVYAAETETGRLWAFDLEEPGKARVHPSMAPHGGRLVCGLPGYQRFDSLAVDAEGNIHVATLVTGCITVVSPDGNVLDQIMTGDPMTTNVCFGGPDMKTAYVTLSGKGELVRMPSARAGLPLAYGDPRAGG
ncbi:SMP-30/gluconolactonase/LRE family protein [Arvimicrobium flavum]|uniref:SMP-30/gluconolactonase/LRE family protein n=1 Tax=Arvimicrobium flavum TaxID=3393320 RepID=UPI00237B8170|nr:SMP-30/gluconolactonase/LRE family protein [Mesorhizobium shangrilense]